jgi:hypothetical protein
MSSQPQDDEAGKTPGGIAADIRKTDIQRHQSPLFRSAMLGKRRVRCATQLLPEHRGHVVTLSRGGRQAPTAGSRRS